MGRADGVVVPGEVEVEVLHRDHLAVASARGAALDPEDGPERRLADADRGAMADPIEPLDQANVGGRLALAERRRRDCRDDHVLAVLARRGRLGFQAPDALQADFRLIRPIQLDFVVSEAEFAGEVHDRPRGDRAGDLEAAWHLCTAHGAAFGLPGMGEAAITASPPPGPVAPSARHGPWRLGAGASAEARWSAARPRPELA